MSKEFISDTILDDRVFQSTQTTFTGDLHGIQLNQSSHFAATVPVSGQQGPAQGDVAASIGQIKVPSAGKVMARPGGIATTIDQPLGAGWVRLGREGEAAATNGRIVVSVVADLTDVSNTLEFASRYADSLVPKGEDSVTLWSWFHNYIAAIPKLGWTVRSSGPQDVDPKKISASAKTVADAIIGIVNADSTFDSQQRMLIQRTMNAMTVAASISTGTIPVSSRPTASQREQSFTVTAARISNGLLTMRTIGVGFQSTDPSRGGGDFVRMIGSAQSMRKEIVDFTAIQSFLDANRNVVEGVLQNSVGMYIESTPLD